MSRIYVYVWPGSGLLGHSTATPPADTVQLTVVHSQSALKRILAFARLGLDGESRIVPGIMEANGNEGQMMEALAFFVNVAILSPRKQRQGTAKDALHGAELAAKGMNDVFGVLLNRQLDYFDRVDDELIDEESELYADDEDPDYEPDYSEEMEEEDHAEPEDELEYDD